MPKNQIAIINACRIVPDARLDAMIKPMQRYLDECVAPHWGTSAVLSFVPLAEARRFILLDRAHWWCLINNTSDEDGALGYHDYHPGHLPFARIFAGDDERYGASLSVTMTHEIDEMLGDPNADTLVTIGPRQYIRELCDAVEADELGIDVDGVLCSNFVLPAYFDPRSAGPWDFRRQLAGPVPHLTPGGYMEFVEGDQWHQLTARLADGSRSYRSGRSGRCQRRATAR